MGSATGLIWFPATGRLVVLVRANLVLRTWGMLSPGGTWDGDGVDTWIEYVKRKLYVCGPTFYKDG